MLAGWILILAVFWCAITGSFSPANLILGLILGALGAWVIRFDLNNRAKRDKNYFKHPLRLIVLTWIFFRELVVGSIDIAIMLLQPKAKWNYSPGIIAVPLDTRDDIEIIIFANMITMIPGTLAVDVAKDNSVLYMHVLDANDPEDQSLEPDKNGKLTHYVKNCFEKKIMWALEQ